MRALVTGITGFVGGHLAEHLVSLGDTVVGCSRAGHWPHDIAHLARKVSMIRCDLFDDRATHALLDSGPFDAVFHLAGMANPQACRDDPAQAQRENIQTTENLYAAIHRSGQRPKILFVSSSYVYGRPPRSALPVRATTAVQTDHPYAATKWQAEQVSLRYASEYELAIVRVRPFNHVGPRQPPGYIVSDWARQIAAIETGRSAPLLRVGDLSTRRDYTDVRDVVRAYRMLVCEPRAFNSAACQVYNLGSGISRSGRDILERLRTLSRTEWKWEVDPLRVRLGEAEEIVADATPLQMLLGWKPEVEFESTLHDTLNYWRSAS